MKKIIAIAMLVSLIGCNSSYAAKKEATVLKAGAEQNVDTQDLKYSGKYNFKTDKIQPAKNKYEYINMNWWANFNDEYLNDYILKAVENNKDLKMASLTVNEYYQNIIMQRANELPTLSAGFMPAYAKAMGNTSGSFALPIIANYEIDLFGKNHNKTTSVRKLYEASVLDEQSAYISIASAVGSVYINIVKLDAVIDLQKNIVNLRKEIDDIMAVSNSEGIASTSDLVKANESYIQGVADLVDLEKERTKLLHQLAVLIGDSPNNIAEYKRIDYKKLSFNGDIPLMVNSDIITSRPDYKKAEKLLEKAGIDVRIARKEMLPNISLGGAVLFNNRHLESLFTTSDMIWGLGGNIIQPLFQGGKLKANLKSKKIVYDKYLRNYEKINLTSMQEVNDSIVSVNKDKEKLNKQKKIQSLEQKDFYMTQEKFKEGVIAKLDLDQKQENLLNVQKMVYNTEFDCMLDYISYYKAVAGNS